MYRQRTLLSAMDSQQVQVACDSAGGNKVAVHLDCFPGSDAFKNELFATATGIMASTTGSSGHQL
jgi:hypothetical protein